MPSSLVIGSRGSRLALWQAEWARGELVALQPELDVRIEVIRTRGDRIQNAPFSQIGGKGVFTKEIEEALIGGRIDLAVHSLKDLPTDLPEGLTIGAVSHRAPVEDALISRNGKGFGDLPDGARVGTSSLRRQAQLAHLRGDLRLEGIRGNVETRLGKLETEGLDAVVLAAAGLERLGLADRICELLPAEQILPAPGQGAMAIEIRQDDDDVSPLMARLDDRATRWAVTAERSVLSALGGGCRVPIGAWARDAGGVMALDAMVASPDGSRLVRSQTSGSPDQAEQLGLGLAEDLAARGAREILDAIA
jgi:hydroxymethylbilane synthase